VEALLVDEPLLVEVAPPVPPLLLVDPPAPLPLLLDVVAPPAS
jgi:hypothetical protein